MIDGEEARGGTGRTLPAALDLVNHTVLQSFAANGIEFAYPTRTLWLREPRGGAPERLSAGAQGPGA